MTVPDPVPPSRSRARRSRQASGGAGRDPNVSEPSALLGLSDAVRLAEPATSSAAGGPVSLSEVVERLLVEFEPELPLPAIYAIVRRCRRELDTQPNPARPELVERLARQRLGALAGGTSATPTGEDTPGLP